MNLVQVFSLVYHYFRKDRPCIKHYVNTICVWKSLQHLLQGCQYNGPANPKRVIEIEMYDFRPAAAHLVLHN